MRKKEKNREVNVPIPRVYFFFAGAFFSSFFGSGFLATTLTSGFYICRNLYLRFVKAQIESSTHTPYEAA
jgi:hypothetical protein